MKSMTGFGRAKLEVDGRNYTVEVKSVNHKYSDISVKLPRSISYLEDKVKKQMGSNISRGKVDIMISFENYTSQGKEIIINQELVKKYIQEFRKCAEENKIAGEILVTEITKLPDVLTIKSVEEEEATIQQELLLCESQAIQNFIIMREQEGNKIKEDLSRRMNEVEEKVKQIEEYSSGLLEEYRVKLQERIKEIVKTEIDEARIATEVVIYADKCSIEEELTRLKSHVHQFNNLLQEEVPVGKKIDFLLQEMNRETNTIGSKSVKLEMTNLVIDIKTTLEDIREQIQNIE